MEVENKLITNFKWLKELPEGECFRKSDSNEIFIKTDKRVPLDNDTVREIQYCCVGLSKGNIENMPNIRIIPVSGKFIVNSDKPWSISIDDNEVKVIPCNEVTSNIVAEDASDYTITLPGGKSAKYDDKTGQFVMCEEKHTCETCRNDEGESNPFDTCHNCHDGSEYEEKTSRTCETCRDQFRHDGSQYCDSCNNYSAWGPKLHVQENLAETLKFLTAKNAELEYRLEQCKEDNKIFPGYCMDCKNFRYVTLYDNNTKKVRTLDCCKHWSEDSDGNTIFAETVADGYCYMFEPKDKDYGTGTWTHGICDNCGYDWGKDAPTASVPEYCPKCGQKKKISSI